MEWTRDGVWCEADQRRAEIFVKDPGLDQHNNVRCEVPGDKLTYEEEGEDPLPAHEVQRYQALVARANFLAKGRSDIQFSVKELAVTMSAPTRGSCKGSLTLGK